jgi:hypothetical protein
MCYAYIWCPHSYNSFDYLCKVSWFMLGPHSPAFFSLQRFAKIRHLKRKIYSQTGGQAGADAKDVGDDDGDGDGDGNHAAGGDTAPGASAPPKVTTTAATNVNTAVVPTARMSSAGNATCLQLPTAAGAVPHQQMLLTSMHGGGAGHVDGSMPTHLPMVAQFAADGLHLVGMPHQYQPNNYQQQQQHGLLPSQATLPGMLMPGTPMWPDLAGSGGAMALHMPGGGQAAMAAMGGGAGMQLQAALPSVRN